MEISANQLRAIVDRFDDLRITVLGDVILDHYIWGEVGRISPEAPVVVVHVSKEEYSLGGAANVAKNIVSLGAKASVIGCVGQDRFSREVESLFDELGISTSGLVRLSDRGTTVKSRVMARSQQVVRVDRESIDEISEVTQGEIVEQIFKQVDASDGFIVSDYAKGVITNKTYAPLASAHQAGQFALSSKPLLVDPKNANFGLYSSASVVKPNRSEAEAASGIKIKNKEDAVVAARKLIDKWNSEVVLVTLGELGMVSVTGDSEESPVSVPTHAKVVYDVSGAGDTVSAVYTLALATGASAQEAAELSNIAAGVVVAEIGAVAISRQQLLEAIQRVKGV